MRRSALALAGLLSVLVACDEPVDRTPPQISVTGVSEGQFSNSERLVIGFSATDGNAVTVSASLNGQPFASGDAVSDEGAHTLQVDARDEAGNAAQKIVRFALDRTAPEVTIAGAAEGERLGPPVTLTFAASDDHLDTVEASLDGVAFKSGGEVSEAGEHTLVVLARDKAGNTTEASRHFIIDPTVASVSFISPEPSHYTSDQRVEVVARTTGAGEVVSVAVGAVTLSRGEEGLYRGMVPLEEGENELTLLATWADGKTQSASRRVYRDSTPPQLTLSAPTEGQNLTTFELSVQGRVQDASPVTVRVNGHTVELTAEGAFTQAVTLIEGPNTVTVEATDRAGNAETITRTVQVEVPAPTLVVTEPSSGFSTTESSVLVKGTATSAVARETLTLTVAGTQTPVDAQGRFERTVNLAMGSNSLEVRVVDARGKSAVHTILGTRVPLEEDGGTGEPDGGSSDGGTPDGGSADGGDETDAGTPEPAEPLELSLESPADALMTNGATVPVSGRISGGTAPFTVTAGSVAASVTGRSFGLALPLDEGEHTLTVQVSDASGRTESLQRRVTVDRTEPFLTITRPAPGTTEVAESPYLVEGEVGDVHLAGVTVQGIAANIVAGKYRAHVTLPSGTSPIRVVATDLAGNREEQVRTVTLNGAPPVVTILEPFSGSESPTPVVKVRARVIAHAPLASVQIGTGTAEKVGPDEYEAEVPLALGDNTLTVTATDVMGLRGNASVQVRYRDPGTEPLRVTGASPSAGETDVTPDRLISVSFNKAVAPNSLAGHFEVLRDGAPLAGGYSLAPGGQTATFIAKAPLPEGARLTIRVRELTAVVGPAQSDTFLSEFDVRRPLTRVRGVVTDESFRPLPGVLVTLEGEGVSTRSGPDGNWALVGIRGGDSVIRYDGGRASDGRSMATVRRRLFLTPESETVDSLLTLTPTDAASAQQVIADAAVHLTFNGRHGALGLDLPSNGLTFESGLTHGSLAATRLEPYAIPVPLSGGFGLTGVWQLAPAGTRLIEAAELQFPNLTGLPAGRRALLFAYDPNLHVIQHVAFGTVTPDGTAIRSEAPIEAASVEYLGYMGLSEAQHQAVEAALANNGGTNGGGTQGLPDGTIQGMLNPQPRPLWKRLFNGVLAEARAQGMFAGSFGSALGALQSVAENFAPAAVTGVVRAPREQQLSIDVLSPSPEVLIGQYEVRDAPFRLAMELRAQQELGDQLSEGGGDPVRLELTAFNPDDTPQGPESGLEWSAEGEGSASLFPTISLREGVTRILVSAKLGTALSRSTRFEAELKLLPEGAPVLPPFPGTPEGSPPEPGTKRYQLTVRRTFDSAEDGDRAFQSLVRFRDLKVTVTGPGSGWSGVTGDSGGYGVQVGTPFGTQQGISCAELPLGTRPVAIVDGNSGTGVRTELVSADFPSCSPAYTVSPGSRVKADILFDVRLLKGALTFVDRQGVALPLACEGSGTERDPETGDVVRLDSQDISATEVHFFREDNLELPIARYTVAAPRPEACGAPPEADQAHAHYARIRPGPATPSKQKQRLRCAEVLAEYGGNVPPLSTSSAENVSFYWSQCVDNRVDFLRLSPGDRIVAVAVNHSTGHTGLARVVVPPISRIARDAEGRCPADEAAGGLLEIIEHGEKVLVSRCAEAEVAIQGDVRLFPPEVDVRIARRAPEEGLRRDALPMSVRQGGAATNRDDYVQVSTHWRVRTRPANTEEPADAPAGADCIQGRTPEGEACAPGMLVDRGEAGQRLEVFCSELPLDASEVQRAHCLPDDLELTDVPAGVPPLAGQIVRVTGAAVEQPAVVAFHVNPGRGSAAVHASMKVKDASGSVLTLNNLTRATYYLHVVGQQVFPRDANGDERLTPDELLASPPDFSWDPAHDPLGRPTQAVQLKNVYRSLEPDGTRVERYDLSREHEFRVLDLLPPAIIAGGASGQRPLHDEQEPAAQESDLSYQFFASLMDVPPEDRGRADVMPGEYVVRLGSDAYGIECPLEIVADGDQRQITAQCEGEFLPEILAASDLLYIELYLSGNADNILYRFNFYGLAPRYDHLSSGSVYTAERSVEVYQGRPVTDRTFSQPAFTVFPVEPAELTQGQLRICADAGCTGEVLKQANLALLSDGSFDVSEVPPQGGAEHRGGKLEQLGEPGIHGARRFSMSIPADFGEMPGADNPRAKPLYLVLDSTSPAVRRHVRVLGQPKGVFVGSNARAPGQESLEGINLSDGHLTFTHEDFAVPHYAETVRFVRTYNNQRNVLSPLGLGWSHNFQGEVLEEELGRYTVRLNGQSHDFPECKGIDVDSGTAWDCLSDKSHGLSLDVRSNGDVPDVTLTTAHGWTYKFDRKALRGDQDGRRIWLLTRYEDGRGREENGQLLGWTRLEYEENSNRVSSVARHPGALKVEFAYEPISEAPDVSNRLKQLARIENFKRLSAVKLLLAEGPGAGTLLHQVDFRHDARNLNLEAAHRGTDLTEAPPATEGVELGGETAGKTTQRWTYTYAPVPSNVSGTAAWALTNEVSKASLLINGSPQWTATYTRDSHQTIYRHIEPREFVTSVVGTGHPDAPLVITPNGGFLRRIQRPDGVEIRVELNAYGNVSKMEFVGGGELTKYDWESDNRGGPAGTDRQGRVYPLKTETPAGLAVAQTPDEKLRTDVTQVQGLPSEALPVPGVAANTTLSRVDSRDSLGRPTQSAFISGGGLATAVTPRNPQGDITSFQLEGTNGETLLAVAAELDADGVALSGTDEAGNQVTYGGFDAQPLHLPSTVTVTHPTTVTDALGSFVEQVDYDAYGRRIRSENVTTGRIEEWNYDGVGRLRWRRLNSVPVQVWSYQYVHGDDELTVTERLNGKPFRETVTKDGLLKSEKTWFNEGQSASAQYQYQGGRLASWTDARGYAWQNVHDEVTGWLLRVELIGGPEVTEPRTAQAFGQLDAEGRPHLITDQDGLVTRVGYDALGRAVQWTRGSDVERVELDANGAELRRIFGLGGRHILQTEVDALGRPTARWNGTLETPPEAGGGDIVILERAQYDGAGRVTERWDRVSGLKETYTYGDVLGRLTRYIREIESGGTTLQLEETRTYVDADGRIVVGISRAIETPDGSTRTEQRTLTLDVAGRVLESSEPVPGAGTAVHAFTYDPRGNLLRHQPPRGGVTTHTYDEQGQLLTTHEPGGVVTRFTYDGNGAVVAKEGPHEHEQWNLTYDAFGRLAKRTLSATPSVEAASWSYAYLAEGEVVETDPRGFQTRRKLNARGQVETETREVADEELVIDYTYDGPWVASASTRLGGTWRHELRRESYDDLGRARTEIEEWSDAGLSYEYSTTSNWSGTRSASITQRWRSGNLPTTTRSSELELDSLGNTLRHAQGGLEDTWRYDAAGLLSSVQPAGVRTAREYTYSQGYLTSEIFGPETTAYTYFVDGRLKSTIEPSGRVRAMEYDDRGLVSKETYGRGSELVTARYTYDAGGNRKTVTHGVQKPAVWNYEYGPLGELTSVTQPGGLGVFRYSYFPDRTLKGVTPPAGSGTAEQAFDYDSLGREILRVRGSSKWATDWSGWSGTTTNTGAAGVGDTVTKLLDGRGRVARTSFAMGPTSTVLDDPLAADLRGGVYDYNGVDQLVSALEVRNSGDVTNAFAYDARNRPLRVERASHLVEYAYVDSGDRSVRVTSRSGSSTYTFDALDRLKRVQSSQGPSATVSWEAGGGRVEKVEGSDVFERYCHDGVGRIASVAAAATDPGCAAGNVGSVFTRFAYSYDEHGNRTEQRSVEDGGDAVTTYGYDLAGRLTGVRYPEGKSVLYRLAPDGTRLGEKVVSAHAGGLGPDAFTVVVPDLAYLEYTPEIGTGGLSVRNLMTAGQPAEVVEVDSAGQVIRKSEHGAATRFHWDPSGRLTKVSNDASSVLARFVYDHGGLRRTSATQHGISEYVWSGEELIEEGLASGAGLVHLAGPAATIGVGGERVLHDALGSAVGRVSPLGDVKVFQFDAWGNYRGGERPGSEESALSYTGHAYEGNLELVYAKQRWLDTGAGRFLAADPLGAEYYLANPVGVNSWLYANANPLLYVDPDGRSGIIDYVLRQFQGPRPGHRPVDPAQPQVVPPQWRAPPLQVYSEASQSPFMEQWYESLRPPVTTLPDGQRMLVFEGERELAARKQRIKVESAIQAIDFGARATLVVTSEALMFEMGGSLFTAAGRWLAPRFALRGAAPALDAGQLVRVEQASGAMSRVVKSDDVVARMSALGRPATPEQIRFLERLESRHPSVPGLVAMDMSAARKSVPRVPGRVQSRINLREGNTAETGWRHVVDRHYNSSKNASRFTVPQEELRALLQSKEVVGAPIQRILVSNEGPRYLRIVELSRPIGLDKFSGFQPTSLMSVLSDEAGNLITATPGVIK